LRRLAEKRKIEALMKAKVRRIYSTALTKLLLDNDFEIVKEKVREIMNQLDVKKMEFQ
jgi:hypothetical protein